LGTALYELLEHFRREGSGRSTGKGTLDTPLKVRWGRQPEHGNVVNAVKQQPVDRQITVGAGIKGTLELSIGATCAALAGEAGNAMVEFRLLFLMFSSSWLFW